MESPNFIWPTVIEAAGIFRWWLAVAAAAKAFNAARPPFQLSPLSLFSRWTMTVSELTHKPSTWLKDCGHSPLCHPQATTKRTGHYQDMIPVTMGHQEWMENLLFLTCSWVTRRCVKREPESTNKPSEGDKEQDLQHLTDLHDCSTEQQNGYRPFLWVKE